MPKNYERQFPGGIENDENYRDIPVEQQNSKILSEERGHVSDENFFQEMNPAMPDMESIGHMAEGKTILNHMPGETFVEKKEITEKPTDTVDNVINFVREKPSQLVDANAARIITDHLPRWEQNSNQP